MNARSSSGNLSAVPLSCLRSRATLRQLRLRIQLLLKRCRKGRGPLLHLPRRERVRDETQRLALQDLCQDINLILSQSFRKRGESVIQPRLLGLKIERTFESHAKKKYICSKLVNQKQAFPHCSSTSS